MWRGGGRWGREMGESLRSQAGFLEEGAPSLVMEAVESGQVHKAGGHLRAGTRVRTAR